VGRDFAQLATTRSLNRHLRKSSRVWELVLVSSTDAQLPGKQRALTTTKQLIQPVEHRVTEEEAGHFGMTDLAGLTKLLLPSDLDINLNSSLLCDGQKVNVVKMPGMHYAGAEEYHILYVRIHSELPE
jgi:hypothetical protein